tara:strand:- start:38 stop:715 length:678 start_codon:yes stop_codon:yes gene_type:complete
MISFHDIAKGSDHLIKFHHVATNLRVEFPAFITEFSDSIQVSWGTETIFGRTDPIKPYQGTTRNINLAFDVLSPTLEKAKENMQNYSKLVQMMYPVYSEPLAGTTGKGRVIKSPPLMRLQFMNLIQNTSLVSDEKGLLGCIGGFGFNPNKESGFFDVNGELFAKNFNISFTFEPQHEEPMGFETNKFINNQFPYGVNAPSEQQGTPSAINSNVIQSRQNNILGDS